MIPGFDNHGAWMVYVDPKVRPQPVSCTVSSANFDGADGSHRPPFCKGKNPELSVFRSKPRKEIITFSGLKLENQPLNTKKAKKLRNRMAGSHQETGSP